MKLSPIVAVVLAVLALSGCADQVAQVRQVLEPLSPPPKSGIGAATPRVSGPVVAQTPPPLQAETSPGSPGAAAAEAPGGEGAGDVSKYFVDTDIREIARTVLGSLLKVTYTIDPGVHGTGTIQTAAPVSREKALSILETLLAQNGAALAVSNGVYRVTANGAAALTPNLVGKDEVGAGTKVIPLRYASAADLSTVLEPFLTPGGKITADPSRMSS